uniref:Uncharacterized protein n=1 Tax=Panagrolaimus sp. JU765 TaxID=591449 RepID=A0AC34RSY4_9BILA
MTDERTPEKPDAYPDHPLYWREFGQASDEDIQRFLIPEILWESSELSLYGHRLNRCDKQVVKAFEKKYKDSLDVGVVFKINDHTFKIEKEICTRSYRIYETSTKKRFFLKVAPTATPS